MSENNLQQLTRQAADLLLNSGRAVMLSGSGVSTPSGTSDIQYTRSGIRSEADPMEVASQSSFRVVHFGEQLPHEAAAEALFDSADWVIVGGSSPELTAAAELPYRALEDTARPVIINRAPTDLDPRSDVVLSADVADAPNGYWQGVP